MSTIRKQEGFENERSIRFPIKNFSDYLEHPLVQGTYISEIGYYPRAKYHYRQRPQGVEETILFYCLEGSGVIEVESHSDTITQTLHANDLFCIPKHCPHTYYSSEETPWTIIWIHFDSSITDFLPIASLKKVALTHQQKRSIIENALLDLFNMETRTLSLANSIFIASTLNHLLNTVYYLEDPVNDEKRSYILTQCIQYMYDNLHNDLKLADLTDKLNISASYLNEIFKSETSKSPIDFFIQLKMDEACKLLQITKMKVYEIAKSLGYVDPYYFSRIFKKHIGVSPRGFRAKPTSRNTDSSIELKNSLRES